MTRIQQYVLTETISVFLLAIVATTLVMTLGVGVNEGMKQGLPFSIALRIMPFVIPETLRITVPASFLFSVCTIFGRMAANGELTAVKSVGVHPFCLFVPVLWMALALSLGTFAMYDVCAIWARPGLEKLLISSIAEVAFGTLRAERSLKAGNLTVAVSDVIGHELRNPRFRITNNDGTTMEFEATTATMEKLGDTGTLRFSCDNTLIHQQKYDGAFPGRIYYDIPFREPTNQDLAERSPAELPSTRLAGQVDFEMECITALQEELRQDGPGNDSHAKAIKHHTRRLRRLQAEAPRRWANGFAIMAFAVIGIPIATWSESTDNMTVFFLCIVPIALMYYPLLVVGEEMARSGFLPQVSVWLAPAVLTLVGILLMKKLVRH